jgi:hypothetical protein
VLTTEHDATITKMGLGRLREMFVKSAAGYEIELEA